MAHRPRWRPVYVLKRRIRIEIGTPLVFREGMRAVRKVRTTYPHLRLLADLKIMDAGEAEADIAFGAGADIVTVMGVSGDETIQGAFASAKKHDGQVMVDMMQVSDPLERADKLIEIGCNLFCLHTAHDQQSIHGSPWRQLAQLRKAFPSLDLAIAGGVNLKVLPQIMPLQSTNHRRRFGDHSGGGSEPCRPFNA